MGMGWNPLDLYQQYVENTRAKIIFESKASVLGFFLTLSNSTLGILTIKGDDSFGK
jgi:hypothetical protein